MVILDTCILIEIVRNNVAVLNKCKEFGSDNFCISSITYVEFLVGSRNKKELADNVKFLNKFSSLPIDENINSELLAIYTKYALSHRPSVPDMLIAATAIHYQLPLYTLNRKDFIYLEDLMLA